MVNLQQFIHKSDLLHTEIRKDGLTFNSELEIGVHKYIHGEMEEISVFSEYFVFFASSSDISAVIQLYDEGKSLISSYNTAPNQMLRLDRLQDATYLKISLRFYGPSIGVLASLFRGSIDEVLTEIKNKLSIKDSASQYVKNQAKIYGAKENYQANQPIILLETLFCDTETDELILDRYISFFEVLICLVSMQTYKNYRWIIHISSDKSNFISKLDLLIEQLNMTPFVVLNVYSHPNEGYDNKSETHIMRINCPNRTFPHLRDGLFNQGLNKLDFDPSLHKSWIIRLGIDDDDFISTSHFERIVKLLKNNAHKKTGDDQEFVFGLRTITCAYYRPSGAVTVEKVVFDRIVHGSKFSAKYRSVPTSPFPIKERFDEYTETSNHIYLDVDDELYTFSYNRHGNNFSTQKKNNFYREVRQKVEYKSQKEYLKSLLS